MPTVTVQADRNKYLVPFILVTSLFFLWAFLHNINPILIPHLKKACRLTDTQSSFIDSAVYLGYCLVALPAGWFMHKFGYKNGILIGLILYGIGTIMFVPAASSRSYTFFLIALFIIASGATFLETVANPYITKLGPKETSEQRLNFAQSFNGVGAVIAPLIGSMVILSGVEHTPEQLQAMSPETLNAYLDHEAGTVKLPYMIIAAVVLVVTIGFFVTKLPEISEADAEGGHTGGFSFTVLRHSHVRWAVIALFFYMGVQAGIGSFIVRFSKYVAGIPEKEAGVLWGIIAMGGFMVGRFAGTYLMKFLKPARLLAIYAVICMVLVIIAMATSGRIAVYSIMAVPFFYSIMFPTIFALGIKGLGEESKIASSLLVMAIVGGGVFPLIMGYISDKSGSIQTAYIVPMLCLFVVLYFALKGHKIRPVTSKN
ncbi:MAG: L-fucose:H+ symporter permease [Chitinophagaceae bacterium]|nr:MAG: L-fucose:H+ symporter permease [Chitinophagaceae bacterium]